MLMLLYAYAESALSQNDSIPETISRSEYQDSTGIRKVLFIGDSMTGWMAERLNAYGDINGFEVATIVWDGSTISKWATASKLPDMIKEISPDAIMVSLGMNELFEPNPEAKLSNQLSALKKVFGEIPFLWIGPPSWPGHSQGATLNNWLQKELGDSSYFRSDTLDLPRQSKSNPHPSKDGIIQWIDEVVEWIPGHSDLEFNSLEVPPSGAVSRGKTFIYRRMKENL